MLMGCSAADLVLTQGIFPILSTTIKIYAAES